MDANDIMQKNVQQTTESDQIEIVEFTVADNFYGINVGQVREIIRMLDTIVPVPDTHEAIAGVINLRGQIIQVVNLAILFNCDSTKNDQARRIIVAECNGALVGFLVGSVTRIYRVAADAVEGVKDVVQSKHGYAAAVVKIDERILFLLDFARIAGEAIRKTDTGIE